MPEEPKIKRGKILRNRYENGSYSGNDMEEYVNTITDPGYPFTLAEFEIEEALDYIRWSEKNGDFIPGNWRLFQRRYGRSRGTFGELIQEIRAEREAGGMKLTEEYGKEHLSLGTFLAKTKSPGNNGAQPRTQAEMDRIMFRSINGYSQSEMNVFYAPDTYVINGVTFVKKTNGTDQYYEGLIDGQRITYQMTSKEGVVMSVYAVGNDKARIQRVPFADITGQFSPDGRIESFFGNLWRANFGGEEESKVVTSNAAPTAVETSKKGKPTETPEWVTEKLKDPKLPANVRNMLTVLKSYPQEFWQRISSQGGEQVDRIARDAGIEPAFLRAVMFVEAGGTPFVNPRTGRIVVRFEPRRYFNQESGKDGEISFETVKDVEGNVIEKFQITDHMRIRMVKLKNGTWILGNEDRRDAKGKLIIDHWYRESKEDDWKQLHVASDNLSEHKLLAAMQTVDERRALASASFGAFQIMGGSAEVKWTGFSSAREMKQAFEQGIPGQVQAFINFLQNKTNGTETIPDPDRPGKMKKIPNHKLWKAVQEKDWYSIATYYNGTQKQARSYSLYENKMRLAYEYIKKYGS